ncbi:hypothetical protein CHISP_0933 [Chitinispirillum alkaliphilum]|nr:hypothetical protein CHISP_0933 [Chitinispirillum alkaliphilum]
MSWRLYRYVMASLPLCHGVSTVMSWRLYRYVMASLPLCHGVSTVMSWRLYRYVMASLPLCHGVSTVMSWRLYRYVMASLPLCHGVSTVMSWRLYRYVMASLNRMLEWAFLKRKGSKGRKSVAFHGAVKGWFACSGYYQHYFSGKNFPLNFWSITGLWHVIRLRL